MHRVHTPLSRALAVLLVTSASAVALGCATSGSVERAARRGDTVMLEQALESGERVEGRSGADDRPLHEAAEAGQIRSVELLLAYGARVDPRDDDGATPLLRAAEQGHDDVVRALLEAGASPDLADEDGLTPLLAAAGDGHGQCVAALLEAGADPNARDHDRRSALWHAVDERDLVIAAQLLDAGADPNGVDDDDESLLGLAISQNDREMVRLLLERGADATQRTRTGNTPLVEALMRNRADLASLLVESGADPKQRSTDARAPIVIAARNNDTAAVMLLLEAGSDPDARGREGDSPLGWAVDHGNLTLIEIYLEAGADPNGWAAHGRTPLYVAVERGRLDVVRMLLEGGADADALNRSGARPMVVAVNRRDEPMIELLAAHGAEPTTSQEELEDMPGFLSKYGYSAVMQAALAVASEARQAAMGGGPSETNAERKARRERQRRHEERWPDGPGNTPEIPDTPTANAGQATTAPTTATSGVLTGDLYSRRVAVVIGIDRYSSWPSLEGARRDGRQVATTLRRMGFDEVIEVYDAKATRTELLRVLGTELPKLTDSNSMAMIYFAGHGQTETLAGGDKRGYVIPVDAKPDQVFATAISIDTLRDISARLPAKQVYYAMDSCYSGMGLVRGVSIEPAGGGAFIEKVTSLRAVQMITAGSEGEQALEQGGQGLFTRYFLRALAGEADFDHDGFVTASEIGTYVRPQVTVASRRRQTPQFGTLEGSGEVAFHVLADDDS